MLISSNLHIKRSEVSIKTRSTPASLSFKDQATKHTTVKWSIALSGTLKSPNKQINKQEQGFKKFIRNVFHCTNQLTKCFALFGVIYTNIVVSMIK